MLIWRLLYKKSETTVAFYKVNNQESNNHISGLLDTIDEYDKKSHEFAKQFGFAMCSYRSLYGEKRGKTMCNLVINHGDLIDNTKWRITGETRDGYPTVAPKKTNKAFYKNYCEAREQLGDLDYTPIYNSVVSNKDDEKLIEKISVGKDNQVLLLTVELLREPMTFLQEITHSEYNSLDFQPVE